MHVYHSIAESAVHNVNFKVLKNDNVSIDTKIDFVHCGNADGIDDNGRPYVLVAFSYYTMTFEVDFVEF